MALFIRTIIKYILVPIGIIYAAFNKSKDEILILMYHRVDDDVKRELAVTRRDFNWQMNYLYRKGYNVIPMDEAYFRIWEHSIRGKNIVITFDDGYEDYYTNAYPVLKRYGFPSIVYLCPGYIGTDKKYWWDKDEKHARLMQWRHIYGLNQEDLVDFGSHTMTHVDMDKLKREEFDTELGMSKRLMEDRLNRSIRHFAYPRGIYSKFGEEALGRYYDTGVLISNGKKIDKECNICNAYTLKRIPILKSDGRYLFIARIKGWLVLEEVIRKFIMSYRTGRRR